MTGRVFLVGAGPGDPTLLTLRAHRLLGLADVVVHDDLVPARLLAGARSDAEIVAVGKVHGDPTRLAQAEIEALLIAHARDGKTVVRLKNGDPCLFGRGGEEAEALRQAGVPFEIVPGIASALAVPAYAGIPVTHRDHASLVTIVTGHAACQDGPPELPWKALVCQGGTLVFLMGMRTLEAILDSLVRHGLDPETPAAAIQNGTLAGQTTVVATVGSLAAQVQAARLGAPGVLVIGAVVSLQPRLRWIEERPLFGRRIMVTRPRAQAAALVERLEDAGAEVILFPTIEIVPPVDPQPLERAVVGAASYDWIVFTSANGVRAFLARMAALERDLRELAGVRLAAIGPETAAELERHLLRPAVVPQAYVAEGLLAALGETDVRGRRFLLPRAAGARPVLPEQLAARGARVDEVIAYRSVAPAGAAAAAIRAELAAGTVDAITLTSSSTVRNLVTALGAEVLRGGRPVLACIGPVTASTARELGLPVAVEAGTFTAAGLADALVVHFHRP